MIDEQRVRTGKLRATGEARRETSDEAAATLALRALAHIAGDEELGPRLLETTGLDVATLRARAGEPVVLAEVLAFLTNHEPSLLACAEALDVPPLQLADAERTLRA
ncbi:DUF3572 family protein [Glacieibacterium sp.]|uniref:DUF3572 family protein n=1 Tax=Glacieibacterium sp. TaxID=2860237 RepID=UPI003B0060AE